MNNAQTLRKERANLDWEGAFPTVIGTDHDVKTGHLIVLAKGIPDSKSLGSATLPLKPPTNGTAMPTVGRLDIPVDVRYGDGPVGDQNRGGRILTDCTSGFTVQNASGVRGMLTAGHCTNQQSYWWFSGGGPFPMQFVKEARTAVADLQWHTTTAQPIDPIFHASPSDARLQGERLVGYPGTYVCRYGKTTGYTCTTVASIDFAPQYELACNGVPCAPVFSRTAACTADFGDSGGPWFLGNSTVGAHKGGGDGTCWYTRVWYFADQLGVTVFRGI